MTAGSLAVILAVLFAGILICAAPALTRRTLQFGVRVPAGRAGAPVIRRERRAYYRRTAAVAACGVAVATVLAASGSAGLTAVVLPAELAADLACFWAARARIAAVKHAEGWFAGLRQTLAADTSWRAEPLRYPVAWLVPAVAVLTATAVIGALRYPDLPARLAVGFSASGHPDRWVGKSPWSAFAKVVGQLWVTGLWAGLLLIIYRSRADTDASDPAGSTGRYRRFLAAFSRALLVLVALVNVSLLLAALRDWQVWRLAGAGAVAPLLPGAAGLLILAAVGVRLGQAGSRLPAPAGGGPVTRADRDDDRFWKGGLIYVNRDDPAVMVASRFGLGWTPNLGNLRACLLYGAIAAAVVALIIIRVVAGAS
jgi:uncharacterized membrane protein